VEFSLENLGYHIICEAEKCNSDILNNEIKMVDIMLRACIEGGAGVLGHVSHKFDPQGVTVTVALSESHACIHSWPEFGVATLDIYTCGSTVEPHKILSIILAEIECQKPHVKNFNRGIPNSSFLP